MEFPTDAQGAASKIEELIGSKVSCAVKAVICEGISRPYSATVTIISPKLFSDSEESEILGSPVRLKAEQSSTQVFHAKDGKTLGSAARTQRSWCAIISALSFVKLLFEKDKMAGAVYELTLSDPLGALKYSFDAAASESNVQGRLTALFKKAGISQVSSNFDQDEIFYDLPCYGLNDYVYLHRLMFLNGINYNFEHGTGSFVPSAFLSRDRTFLSSDQKELSASLHASGSAAFVLKNFQYRRLQTAGDYQQNLTYAVLGNLAGNVAAADDDQVNEAAQAFLANLDLTKASCSCQIAAKVSDISLQCGRPLKLGDFNDLQLVPKETVLHCETSYSFAKASNANQSGQQSSPPKYRQAYEAYASSRGASSDDVLEQNVRFLKIGSDNPGSLIAPGCADLALLQDCFETEPAAPAPGPSEILPRHGSLDAMVRLGTFEAEVCDEKGSTALSYDESTSGEGEVPSCFYAKPLSGSDRSIIKVQALSVLGGNGRGMFALPRPGERVLILASGSRYYLLGYLTAPAAYGTYDVASSFKVENPYSPALAQSSRWVYSTDANVIDTVSSGSEGESKGQSDSSGYQKITERNYYGISFEQFDSEADFIASAALDGSLPLLVKELAAANGNNNSYETAYEAACTDLEKALSGVMAARAALCTYTGAEGETMPDVAGAVKTFKETAGSLAESLGYKETPEPRLKLYAGAGNIDLSPPTEGSRSKPRRFQARQRARWCLMPKRSPSMPRKS